MATQVLGHTVHHDVSTEVERRLQIRTGEGVVHTEQAALLLRQRGQCGDVDDAEQWVRGCLGPDQPGVRCDRRRHVRRVAHVHEPEFQTEALKDLGEEPIGAAVQVVATHHLITGLEQFHDRIDARHSTAEAQAVLPVLERRERVLQGGTGRIMRPAVLVSLVVAR